MGEDSKSPNVLKMQSLLGECQREGYDGVRLFVPNSRDISLDDNELTVRCMNILMDNVGPVDAERFVSIVNLNHFDYTEWRKDHLFVGETVDTLVDKIRAFEREHSELAEVTHA